MPLWKKKLHCSINVCKISSGIRKYFVILSKDSNSILNSVGHQHRDKLLEFIQLNSLFWLILKIEQDKPHIKNTICYNTNSLSKQHKQRESTVTTLQIMQYLDYLPLKAACKIAVIICFYTKMKEHNYGRKYWQIFPDFRFACKTFPVGSLCCLNVDW